nr:putative ribonuclease H-like domain-containing protein [Tanacetum cinerariifolium]
FSWVFFLKTKNETSGILKHCLFACFLSQIKPKKISQALEDESWVDAMQEELLQFKIQKVWILDDLPFEKKAIRTKWVYRNTKDESGVVVKNKARAWYATLSTFLMQSGYRRGLIDKTMFIKKDNKNIMLVTPKTLYFQAVKRIYSYLKGQPKLGLWYPRESAFDLEAYLDSDYAGVNLDRKFTTKGCQFLGRRLISWQCKKQTIEATSTTATEYVVAASCCGQVLWIQNQMLDYGFNFMNTKIYIDNERTICIVKNPVFHSKIKHIKIRHHFIRDDYKKKLIQVLKIHTDDNVADLLTKAFNVSRFNFLIVNI